MGNANYVGEGEGDDRSLDKASMERSGKTRMEEEDARGRGGVERVRAGQSCVIEFTFARERVGSV